MYRFDFNFASKLKHVTILAYSCNKNFIVFQILDKKKKKIDKKKIDILLASISMLVHREYIHESDRKFENIS